MQLKSKYDIPSLFLAFDRPAADHDDRIVPAHSFKFAAMLQACQGGQSPVLIRIESKAGQGGMSGVDKKIALSTDQISFMAGNLDMGW